MNVKHEFKKLDEYFSPKIIGDINDTYVKIVKIKGDKVPWHKHEKEDELFYIIEGNLKFEIEGEESFIASEGDLFIIKKNSYHKVTSKEECKILLIENKTTLHTGNVASEITKTIENQRQ